MNAEAKKKFNGGAVIVYWRAEKGLQGAVYLSDGVEIPGVIKFSGLPALTTWAAEQGLQPVLVNEVAKLWGRA